MEYEQFYSGAKLAAAPIACHSKAAKACCLSQLSLPACPTGALHSFRSTASPRGSGHLLPCRSGCLTDLLDSTRDFLSGLLRKENVWLRNAACLTTLNTIYKLWLPLINTLVPDSKM